MGYPSTRTAPDAHSAPTNRMADIVDSLPSWLALIPVVGGCVEGCRRVAGRRRRDRHQREERERRIDAHLSALSDGQKRMTDLLMATQVRVATAMDRSPTPSWETDAAGNCIDCNHAYERLLGRTKDDLRGTGWEMGIHPDDRGRVVARWRDSVRDRRPYVDEFRVCGPGGAVRVKAEAREMRNSAGEVVGYVGTTSPQE